MQARENIINTRRVLNETGPLDKYTSKSNIEKRSKNNTEIYIYLMVLNKDLFSMSYIDISNSSRASA